MSKRRPTSQKYGKSIRDQILDTETHREARGLLGAFEAAVRVGDNHASSGTRRKWHRAAECVRQGRQWLNPWRRPWVGRGITAVLAVACLAALGGCSLTQVDQSTTTGPTTVTQAPPPTSAPAVSASPSPGTHGTVARVEVHFYGTQTCSNLKPPPSGVREVGVACIQPVTASPFDAGGVDVGQPTDIVTWACSSGVEIDNPEPNSYNRSIKGAHAGAFTCTATTGGVVGTLDGTVVP